MSSWMNLPFPLPRHHPLLPLMSLIFYLSLSLRCPFLAHLLVSLLQVLLTVLTAATLPAAQRTAAVPPTMSPAAAVATTTPPAAVVTPASPTTAPAPPAVAQPTAPVGSGVGARSSPAPAEWCCHLLLLSWLRMCSEHHPRLAWGCTYPSMAYYLGLYLSPDVHGGTILTKLCAFCFARSCSCFSGGQSSSNGHPRKGWLLTAGIPCRVSFSHFKDLSECSRRS